MTTRLLINVDEGFKKHLKMFCILNGDISMSQVVREGITLYMQKHGGAVDPRLQPTFSPAPPPTKKTIVEQHSVLAEDVDWEEQDRLAREVDLEVREKLRREEES